MENPIKVDDFGVPLFLETILHTDLDNVYIYMCGCVCAYIHIIIIHMSMKKNKIKQVHVAHQSRTPHVKTLVPTWHVQQEVVSSSEAGWLTTPITYIYH